MGADRKTNCIPVTLGIPDLVLMFGRTDTVRRSRAFGFEDNYSEPGGAIHSIDCPVSFSISSKSAS